MIFSGVFCITDPEHSEDQEVEEETTQKNREERHAGYVAEVTEAEQ